MAWVELRKISQELVEVGTTSKSSTLLLIFSSESPGETTSFRSEKDSRS